MAKVHKTIRIEALIDRANAFLLHSEDGYTDQRLGVIHFIEGVLHSAGAYSGFHYLNIAHMAKSEGGSIPGIVWDSVRELATSYPDQTRRHYYTATAVTNS